VDQATIGVPTRFPIVDSIFIDTLGHVLVDIEINSSNLGDDPFAPLRINMTLIDGDALGSGCSVHDWDPIKPLEKSMDILIHPVCCAVNLGLSTLELVTLTSIPVLSMVQAQMLGTAGRVVEEAAVEDISVNVLGDLDDLRSDNVTDEHGVDGVHKRDPI
jgi:hypothetical protein